jgi:hypothetical protein
MIQGESERVNNNLVLIGEQQGQVNCNLKNIN